MREENIVKNWNVNIFTVKLLSMAEWECLFSANNNKKKTV